MKKMYRLKRNKDISKIVSLKQVKNSISFSIYYQTNELNQSRVCVSVSKKIGIAVVRNKIKRQVREMIKHCFDFNINKDYVVVVRKKYLGFSFEENENILKTTYKKIQ